MSLRTVVVTYNSAAEVATCLQAVSRFCPEARITVIDNASADDTVAQVRALALPQVLLVENKTNRGFAAAVNQAVAQADEDLILLLNPDVELLSSPAPLIRMLETGECGIAAGRLVGSDGLDQKGFGIRRFPTPTALAFEVLGLNRIFPNNPENRRYRCADLSWNSAGEVEQPAGAFLAFERKLWQRLGGFDERFFPVWFEDVDFCKRAKENGVRIYYLPGVTAKHSGGHSVNRMAWECRQAAWYASLLKYASKHFRPLGRQGVGVAVAAGSVLRALISIARRRSLRPAAVYAQVFRLGARCMFSGALAGGSGHQEHRLSENGSGGVGSF